MRGPGVRRAAAAVAASAGPSGGRLPAAPGYVVAAPAAGFGSVSVPVSVSVSLPALSFGPGRPRPCARGSPNRPRTVSRRGLRWRRWMPPGRPRRKGFPGRGGCRVGGGDRVRRLRGFGCRFGFGLGLRLLAWLSCGPYEWRVQVGGGRGVLGRLYGVRGAVSGRPSGISGASGSGASSGSGSGSGIGVGVGNATGRSASSTSSSAGLADGSFSRRAARMSCNGPAAAGSSGSSYRTACSVARVVSRENGERPPSAAQSVAPRDHTSDGGPWCRPDTRSGAM